ncbi:MAG: C40 family peptidase [Burkholderiales bacterium]
MRTVASQAVVMVAGLLCAQAVWAAPAQGDPVSRFLQDRGLLSATTDTGAARTGLLNQVRERASDLVLTAMNFLGVPYRRGGTTEEAGFDCSGFTRHVFENSLGLLLPRRSQDQANSADLQTVRKEELKPGDLVFFNTMRHAFSHVGIYVGEGKFIHSPRSGGEVRVEDMREGYWTKRYNGARRAPVLSASADPAATLPTEDRPAP